MRRDLFAEDGGYCQDVALLDRLVKAKLDEAAATLKAEGWHWTEARLSFDWNDRQAFTRAEPDYEETGDEADEDAEAFEFWADEVKAMAGAVVSLGYDGTLSIERGLIRPGDMPDEKEEGEKALEGKDGTGSPGRSPETLDPAPVSRPVDERAGLSGRRRLRDDTGTAARPASRRRGGVVGLVLRRQSGGPA